VIVDTHTHVNCTDTGRYPRSPRGVGSDWWRTDDHGAGTLQAAMDAAGVDRAVVVQAVGPYGYDCRCAIDEAARSPERLSLVVAVDLAAPAPAEALRELAAEAPLAGIRLFGIGDDDEWLENGSGAAMWEAAGELGVTVVPVVFPRHVARVGALVAAHPGVAVAMDHAGFPDLPLTDDAPILGLADYPDVHLKVSSHVLEGVTDPPALVARLAEAFGADRLCWGSDYPQTSVDYGALVRLGQQGASGLAAQEREAFLSGTALRLFPVPGPTGARPGGR
jgi:predicted TIM-barrel fold metal-dependent hydrolase